MTTSHLSILIALKTNIIECGFEVQMSNDEKITKDHNNYNSIPYSLSSMN